MTHHTAWRIAAGVALVLCASGGVAAVSAHEHTLEVRLEEDRLSVEVGAVPLMDVLNAIAERTGAELRIRGELGAVRPQAFEDTPLPEAVRQLVEPNSFALSFAPAHSPGREPRLASLTVYAREARSLAAARAEPVPRLSQADPPEAQGRLPDLRGFARGGDADLVAALARALEQDPGALRPGVAIAAPRLFGTRDDVHAHRTALASADPAERIEALHAIGGDPESSAIGPLLRVLVGDEDAAVRRTAVEILAGLDSEDAVAALEGALFDPNPSVRAAAAQALVPGDGDAPQ